MKKPLLFEANINVTIPGSRVVDLIGRIYSRYNVACTGLRFGEFAYSSKEELTNYLCPLDKDSGTKTIDEERFTYLLSLVGIHYTLFEESKSSLEALADLSEYGDLYCNMFFQDLRDIEELSKFIQLVSYLANGRIVLRGYFADDPDIDPATSSIYALTPGSTADVIRVIQFAEGNVPDAIDIDPSEVKRAEEEAEARVEAIDDRIAKLQTEAETRRAKFNADIDAEIESLRGLVIYPDEMREKALNQVLRKKS